MAVSFHHRRVRERLVALNVSDPELANVERAHFMKNVALVGACLALFALVAHVGSDLGLTITAPLFELD